MERLAFIKYLYTFGMEQSRKTEPFAWTSVLTFHDAIELYLELAAEHLDVSKRLKELAFMQYWDLLNPALIKKGRRELTQKIVMDKLNEARVSFKHHGIPPSKSIIEDLRPYVTNFLEENTPNIFDIEFSSISLIELVKCQAAKDTLKEAQRLLKDDKTEEVLDKTALAFVQLIDDYENRKKDEFGRSPFFFGKSMTFLSSFHMGIPHRDKLADFVDHVKESIEAIQESVKVLSLGLDYRRYARFHLLTPVVLRLWAGEGKMNYSLSRISKIVPTKEDAQYCIDFVVESAVTLQAFDFEVRRKTPLLMTYVDQCVLSREAEKNVTLDLLLMHQKHAGKVKHINSLHVNKL